MQDPTQLKPTWFPTDFDQTHNLIAVASYAWKTVRFGLRFRLVSGAPDTPRLEGVFDADEGTYACRTGAPNSTRKPTFHQLDFRVDKKWTFKAWEFGIYADLQNIYNAENREGTVYDYRCRTSVPIRGVPFFPNWGSEGCFETRSRNRFDPGGGRRRVRRAAQRDDRDGLRVLGVKCEPAGFLVKLEKPGSAMADALKATLTALVVDPQGQGYELHVSAVGCPDYIDTITSATLQGSKLCPPASVTSHVPAADRPYLATTTIVPATRRCRFPVGGSGIEYEPTVVFGLRPDQVGAFFSPTPTGVPALDQSITYNRDFGLPAIVNLTSS